MYKFETDTTMKNSRKITIKKEIIKTISFGFFMLLAMINVSCGQVQTEEVNEPEQIEKANKIDALVSAYAEYGKFNGSILVANEGKVIYKKGFGFANMEWDIPNQTDTKHRIASITKQFTALLIVQLAEENKLDLQASISTYLPDYPEENGKLINIHQLLTHTSGIPDYGGFSHYRALERERYRPTQIMDLFSKLPLEFTPGERYQYSNSGYVILGVIIEKITGKRYAQVLQDKILKPLKMNNTGYDGQRDLLKNRAAGYYKIWGKYKNTNFISMSLPYAAGALYSTVEDLYLWDQALYTEQLLSKKYMDLCFGKYIETRGRHYGYGWFIDEMNLEKTNKTITRNNHGGGLDGFRTRIIRVPSSKSLVVVLNNTESVELFEMTDAINNILHDQPYTFPDKPIAQFLLKTIQEEGIQEARSFYKKVKNTKGHYIREDEMIIAGYDLLHTGKAEEAAIIFELSIDAFPKAYNVYDSYAEALMELGRKEEAIKNYKKSVELNPKNQNGIDMLKKLGVSDK